MRLTPTHMIGGGLIALAFLATSRAAAASSHVVDGGRVSSPYGCRTRAGNECGPCGSGRQMHLGVDISAPRGKAVRAPIAGKVVKVMPDGGWTKYGNVVLVGHPSGVTTLYAHLDSILVTAGENISAGTPLGTVGTTGIAESGPHCHFEVLNKRNATAVNGFTRYTNGVASGCNTDETPKRIDPIAWLSSVGSKAGNG